MPLIRFERIPGAIGIGLWRPDSQLFPHHWVIGLGTVWCLSWKTKKNA